MKRVMIIVLILTLTILSSGFSQTASDDSVQSTPDIATPQPDIKESTQRYEPDNLYNYLKDIYSRNDDKLRDYLTEELWQFLNNFSQNKNAAEVTEMLAKIYLDDGDEAEAVAACLRGLFMHPDHPSHSELLTLVRKIIPKWRIDDRTTEKLYLQINASFNADSEASRFYNYISFLYHLNEDDLYEWTIRESQHFLHRFTEFSGIDSVMTWIGDIYFRMGDEREAVASYSKLLFVVPDSPIIPSIQYKSAVLLSDELDEHRIALEKLSEIVAKYPDSRYAGDAYFEAGKIKEKHTKEYVGAIAEYRKLVENYPTHENAINALFSVAEIQEDELKDYHSAIETYEEIITRFQPDTRCIKALEEMADIYEDELKEYYKSAESYARIADIFPDDEKSPEMLIEAGSICEKKLDDYTKAIEYYQLVLDKFPEHSEVREAEKKIVKATEKIRENTETNEN
mgnify:CR=1 FL=1